MMNFGMIGTAPAMRTLFRQIDLVAKDNDVTVLILGESGCGKELVANAIHKHSERSAHNFVPVNVPGLPDELLESELFGCAKGAFTGAVSARIGRFQHAHRGTIFLDEIGDMKPSLQAKLLRVLQERSVEQLGSVIQQQVDVRVIAATNMDLESAVKEGRFREDLFYRLNVVPIEVPPLRERRSDIPALLGYFVQRINAEKGRAVEGFSDEAVNVLLDYPWPGNVRELEHLVQRMCVFRQEGLITATELPARFRNSRDKVAPICREPKTYTRLSGREGRAV